MNVHFNPIRIIPALVFAAFCLFPRCVSAQDESTPRLERVLLGDDNAEFNFWGGGHLNLGFVIGNFK